MSDTNLRLRLVMDAVDKMTGPLQFAIKSNKALAKAVSEAKGQVKDLQKVQSQIDSYQNTGKNLGITNNELVSVSAQYEALKERLGGSTVASKTQQKELEKLKNQTIELSKKSKDLSESYERQRAGLEAAKIPTKDLAKYQADLAVKIGDANKALDAQNAKFSEHAARMGKLNAMNKLATEARTRTVNATMQLGALVASASTALLPVTQASVFEKAMLGVAKQVDGSRDSAGNLTSTYFEMARQIQKLGREIPIATNDLAEMVAAGARMGIVKDELIGFTRTAAIMANAFDLPAGELAEQMGKIATLYKIPIPAIGELADVINYLDDNAISKGSEIIDVMKRIGGTAEFLKMPAREAAALASTFLTLGSSAEIAGTAANAVMRELSIATMQPKRFKEGLAAIGMGAKAIQDAMSKDATGTILKVLDALNKIPDEKRLTVATQMFGKEYGDDLAKLASGVDEYRRQIALAKSDGAMGSMLREHNAQIQTTSAKWEILKNRVQELSVTIGEKLGPITNKVLGGLGGMATKINELIRNSPILTSNIGAVIGALAGSFAVWKLVTIGIWGVTWAFRALSLAFATNPIGLILTGIAVGAALLWNNWDLITAKFKTQPDFWFWLGDQVTFGFLSGLMNRFQGVKAWIERSFGQVIDWAKTKLGIQSPSRVFAEIGEQTMAGFNVGFGGGANDAFSNVKGMMAKVTAAGAAGALMVSGTAYAATGSAPLKAAASSTTVVDNATYNVYVTAETGANPRDIAQMVADQVFAMRRSEEAMQRSRLIDLD